MIEMHSEFMWLGYNIATATTLSSPEKENITLKYLCFYDDKAVKPLCSALRKPKSTIDSRAVMRGAPEISNP